ncbi:hypothetical protein LJC60_05520 [Ruminococcaceae bacterium OttesenSCG-928-D13]|nr:hypothetical protein [Ruminococcaceae bacterium OttesenSCG-928-D13]
MSEVPFLTKTLTVQEYERAKPLFDAIITEGIPPDKAAAMLYRRGFLDGKSQEKEARKAAFLRRKAQQETETTSPPEATTEGSNENV